MASRRAFLKASAAASAGAVIPSYDVALGGTEKTTSSGDIKPQQDRPETTNLGERMTGVLSSIRTKPLFTMRLTVKPILVVGNTPTTLRRIGVALGGEFQGERLSGSVLDGGNDWQSVRSDGSLFLDGRMILKIDDGDLVSMTYRGIRHGPADVIARLEQGQFVDPETYYQRINTTFETASAKYGWLNRIIAVGTGHRFPDGPTYNVFEVL